MRVLVDTNVLVASLTDEPSRGAVATDFLNGEHEYCTSLLNLMELRSVMTKKKRSEQERVEEVLDDLFDEIDVYAPEISDQIAAYSSQRDNLLYTTDCLLLALAEDIDATLVTFDAELLEHGAEPPGELIES
jgi:predicted nucleic acid-binding protein